MKFGHLGLPVSDIEKAKTFYSAIASHVGLELLKDEGAWVGYGNDASFEFFIHTDTPGVSGVHLCFETTSKAAVDAFYEAAITVGGSDNGTPGIREDYSPTYYAAFVFDPDGNNIEAMCRH